jgi:diacylglycerol kinase (ATP)
MKATLVHNPTSGEGEMTREALTDLMHKAGITPYYQSSKIGELTAVLAEPTDLIVVAGGDGTVAKVLTQMPDRGVPVAILPLGTANNVASSFGIGGELDELALGMRNAEERKLDVGMARGPWGCCYVVEGIGFGALVRTSIALGKPDGSREDKLAAARKRLRKVLKKAEPDRLHILLDDEPMPDAQLMVEVLNIACAGPRLFLAPDTDMADGLIEVGVLEPDQRDEMRRWLEDERPSGPPPMTFRRGQKVNIFWDGTPLHVDDDTPPAEDSKVAVEFSLEKRSVKVLAPKVEGEPGVPE